MPHSGSHSQRHAKPKKSHTYSTENILKALLYSDTLIFTNTTKENEAKFQFPIILKPHKNNKKKHGNKMNRRSLVQVVAHPLVEGFLIDCN